MIELLDYILDYDDNFWIMNELIGNKPKGFIVYKVDENGNRFNNITKKRYIKLQNNGEVDLPKQYKMIFKPQEFYKRNKKNLQGIWKKYVEVLNEIGIEDKDIGIFGSYLIGFDIVKDVDFIIYGARNLEIYRQNNYYIKEKTNTTFISEKHINHQYEKYKDKYPKECDLKEIIKRNWSGIQVKEGVLSTPRFIDKTFTNIPEKKGKDKLIKVKVINGEKTDLLPRVADVLYKGEVYKIITQMWKFQSFARKGDIFWIYGNVNDEDKIIILDKYDHYLKFVNKEKEKINFGKNQLEYVEKNSINLAS